MSLITGTPLPPLEPGSPAWLKTMSASKIASVVGLSPYQSKYATWYVMAGLLAPEPGSAVTRRGQYLEAGIRRWLADQHPEWDLADAGTYARNDEPRFTATPDGFFHGFDADDNVLETRGVEVKTASDGTEWGPAGSDEIPVGYRAQVQWQMYVVGTRVTHVAVLLPFLELREYVITYDEDDAAFLAAEARAFLDSLPTGLRPQVPDIDSTDSTYQAIRQIHPLIEDIDVTVEEDIARAYCDTQRALKLAKARAQYETNRLADVLGSGRRAVFDGRTLATRQARGDAAPFVLAARTLPTFFDSEESAA